ncbi:TetR/AcrR family transcriptional regulator [Roseobacter ponti]|uniref:TetR/AcrR family transcriptional regulator n=1 Tax=Roseobacter ponti TaxID=1891787 RepID=A0A858SXP5_9RHOB|nr:TetR/AcrR family transcriptional regulator [Roseobacter ponti]QJF52612.1 TetR/AcrR family transcriptional regulator [Roseobacter ponti]
MSGLREKQKADRRSRILGAAVSQFRAGGYRSVRIGDIAGRAGVSVGTVYNYYQTKGDILIAVVAMEVEEVLEAGAELVANPPGGVQVALLSLIYGYYDHSLEYLSKEMWRSAMALSIEAPGTRNGQLYHDLDRRLAAQVTDLVAALQSRGDVRVDLDAQALGGLIFSNLNQNFIDFVKDDEMSLAVLKTTVADQTGPFARLISA